MAKGKDFLPPPIYSGRVRQNKKKKQMHLRLLQKLKDIVMSALERGVCQKLR